MGYTRRETIRGAAAAAAAALLAPTASAATRARVGGPGILTLDVGRLDGITQVLRAPRPFALAGVSWAAPAHARVALRTRDRADRWSRWIPAALCGHGPDAVGPGQGGAGEPIWVGEGTALQLQSPGSVLGVRVHLVEPPSPPVAPGALKGDAVAAAAALPLAQPVFGAGPGQPPIIARSAWAHGARPAVAPAYGAVRLAFVHHTENANAYLPGEVPPMLYAIYQYHRYVRGWDDIGYNFVIDHFGRIWEARAGGVDRAVIGAQAGGYNAVSTGVAVLGSFTDVVPPPAALRALEHLLAWKLSLHGLPSQGRVTVAVNPADAFYTPFRPGQRVSLPRVAGHRDGDSTDCPGTAFYDRLPAVRPQVTRLAGQPARLEMEVEVEVETRVASSASSGVLALTGPGTVTVTGRLTTLGSAAPIAGAGIDLQRLEPGAQSTLLTAQTASDGTYAFTLPVSMSLSLRTLHAQAPVVASAEVAVALAPAVSLELVSSQPLRVAGRLDPALQRVTIEVLRVRRDRRRVIARHHERVSAGRFEATIELPRHGHFLLQARTAATRAYAAGASAPLRIAR